jgi:hypothetical protein
MNDIEQYKTNKINNINIFYNNKVNERRQLYNNEYNSISRGLIPVFQKNNLLSKILNKYNNDIKELKSYVDQQINYIKNVKINDINIKNKKAFIIGINYNGTKNKLNGCINDANNVCNFIKDFGFKNENINIMTDETQIKPTFSNIINSFTNFIKSGNDGDLLFLYYSGHGSQTYDYNGDERDGKDELIITSDLAGITDDKLKQIIQSNLKKNVTLFCLFDCCNSGTILDLKYQYLSSNEYELNNDVSITDTDDKETMGNVILLSGCRDEQYSYEIEQSNNLVQGIMTTNFINIVKSNPLISWRELLIKIRNIIKDKNIDQIPQLSSGKIINMNSKIYL